jgi:MFS family permease
MTLSQSSAVRNAVACMSALIVGMSVGRFAYTPILPVMIAQHALTHETGALLASANLFGYLVGAFPAGLSWTRKNRLAVLRWALIFSVATFALMALPASTLTWGIIRFASGVASAFIFVCATSLVLDLAMPTVTVWTFSSVGAGIAITGALIPWIYAREPAWQSAWIVVAILSTVLALVASLLAIDVHAARQEAIGKPEPLDGTLFVIYLTYGIAGFAYVIPATFLVTIAASWSWIVVGAVAWATIFAWGPLAQRFGKPPMFAAALLVMMFSCAGPLIGGVAGALVSSCSLGASFMAVSMLATGLVRDLRPHESMRRIGEITVTFSVGQVLGPLAAAAAYARTGSYDGAFFAGAAGLLAAAIAARLFVRRSIA